MFFGFKMLLILIQSKVLQDSNTSVNAGERERVLSSRAKKKKKKRLFAHKVVTPLKFFALTQGLT